MDQHRWDEQWILSDNSFNQKALISPTQWLIMSALLLFISTFYFYIKKLRRNFTASIERVSEPRQHEVVNNEPIDSSDISVHSSVENRVKPIVSIAIDHFFHPEKTVYELEKDSSFELKQDDLPVGFLNICKESKVVLISKVESDEEERIVRNFVQKNLVEPYKEFLHLPSHRMLFSSTLEGRVSMIRHLKPTLHIDTVKSVVDALIGKVPNCILYEVGKDTTTLQNCAEVMKSMTNISI